jgi:hypothetical protein
MSCFLAFFSFKVSEFLWLLDPGIWYVFFYQKLLVVRKNPLLEGANTFLYTISLRGASSFLIFPTNEFFAFFSLENYRI